MYSLRTSVFKAEVLGVPVYLFRPDNQFFKGKQIYAGGYSATEAYLYFCRAALVRRRSADGWGRREVLCLQCRPLIRKGVRGLTTEYSSSAAARQLRARKSTRPL